MTQCDQRRIPPEFDLTLFSFLLHFVWEFLQAPLYANMHDVGHIEGVAICLRATLGDVVIALAAFWCTAALTTGRHWGDTAGARSVAIFLAVGILATVVLEHLFTEITNRWSYGEAMIRLPFIGTGLSPIAQWVVVPLIVLWLMRRVSRPRL